MYRYSYRPARFRARYRPRYRACRRYGSGRVTGREVAVAAVIALVLAGPGRAVIAHAAGHAPAVADAVQPAPAAARAVAYATAQLGKPYQWGGTGPYSYDCSGLVMMAWRAAGVDIARTSQTQWATLPHIPASQVRPGDLVFFPGSDGSWSAPGHVAMVISRTQMIQAPFTGANVEISPLSGSGAGGIIGYARP